MPEKHSAASKQNACINVHVLPYNLSNKSRHGMTTLSEISLFTLAPLATNETDVMAAKRTNRYSQSPYEVDRSTAGDAISTSND